MQLLMTVIDPGAEPPASRDVLVEAATGATLLDVADDLRRSVGCTDAGLGFRVAGRPIVQDHPLGAAPLLRGAVLTVDRPHSPRMPPPSDAVVHLAVVAGPGAGRVIPLGRGVTIIGRSGGCGVRLTDGTVSRHHLEVSVTSGGVTVRELAPTNLARLNGVPLGDGRAVILPGDRLEVGATTLVHRTDSVTPAACTVGDGMRRVHRPPRFLRDRPVTQIEFPAPPTQAEHHRLPLIAALVPMVLSTVLSVVLRSPVMMLFALLTPAMLLGQWWSDRRHGRVSGRRRLAEYARLRVAAEARLAEALEREHVDRFAESPDLATVGSVVSSVDARLWERRPDDPDYLSLRVGVGPQPARTGVLGDGSDLPSLPLLVVPAVVRLPDCGVVAVAGPRDRGVALVSGLIGQLCAWHSPRDVRLVLLTAEDDGGRRWHWASLLPHLAPLDDTCLAAVGDLSHEGPLGQRLALLTALVATRAAAKTSGWSGPDVVVVLDGSERLRRLPGIADLLRDGPAAGVRFICLDREATRLPAEARVQLLIDSGPAAVARLDGEGESVPSLVPDLPDETWVEQLARAAAPLEDATPREDGAAVPERVDFLELHRRGAHVDPLDAASVASRWAARRGSTIALLGGGSDGPIAVDLVRDGPHALVGGTTGAGKSELLQTLVTSLAVHSPPDEVSFVLIDYKGGSAFRDCAALPHVLGVVTDLDEHLTARALTSLTAELKRRERILATAGAKDLDDYRRLTKGGEPLARLVLVVDEFKVLAEELPEFVSGLVRLAAIGRSLGVHLVLATQRPAGIISADIRANVAMRIALRVRDRSDSDDIIQGPEAALISDRLPGRAYLRGGSQDLVSLQVAHLATIVDRSPTARRLAGARPLDWGDLMTPAPTGADTAATAGPATVVAVASALAEAAQLLDVEAAVPPWLPPLPDVLLPGDDRLGGHGGTGRPVHGGTGRPVRGGTGLVPLGLVDRPAEQRQEALTWDVLREGHLGIAGGARTGRTTALLSIALRLAERCAPSKLHLHVLQGAPGTLDSLAALPHCGSVSGADDPQRLRRAILRLAHEENRPGCTTVVLVDGWETITDALDDLDHGESTERLLSLARDGLSRRVHVVVTGGRPVASGRLASLLQRRLVLDMPDPVDLTLAGVTLPAASRHRQPGRALDLRDEAEVQLTLPTDWVAADCRALDDTAPDNTTGSGTVALGSAARDGKADGTLVGSAATQSAGVARAVAAIAAHWGPVPRDAGPWRLLPLPAEVQLARLEAEPQRLLVGLGGDDLRPLGFDLARDERRILVLGQAHSGKSTALATLLSQLLSHGRQVAVIAPRRSPLAQRHTHGALHVFRPDEADQFITLRREHPDLAVVVDDADTLEGTPLESALVETTRLADAAGGVIVVALDLRRAAGAFRGLVPEVARGGAGLVLWPASTADGDLLRLRVEPQGARHPGRGVLVAEGEATPVQVAVAPMPNAVFEGELPGVPLSSTPNAVFEGELPGVPLSSTPNTAFEEAAAG